tara:strand:+ start:29 stop:394 length:366 start_codon:yes stop_codon:yes gene_type:complete
MARAAQRAAQPRSRRAQLALRTTSFRLGSGPTNEGRPPHGGVLLASFLPQNTHFLPFLNPEKLFLKHEKIIVTSSITELSVLHRSIREFNFEFNETIAVHAQLLRCSIERAKNQFEQAFGQ